MKRAFLVIGAVVAISLACVPNAGPVPATPVGGGAVPTATLPAGAGGGVPTASQSDGGPGGAGSPEHGKQLFTAKGCIACHTVSSVPGAVGTIGPNLDIVGDPAKYPKIAGGLLDNNEQELRKWLSNPPSVKPGTQMPNLVLSRGELNSMVAFLQTLK